MSTPRSPALRQTALRHYDVLALIGRALSSPARLRLLDLLRQSPRTVEALAEQAELSVANASQHLKQLRAARLVVTAKHAQRVEYRLADARVDLLFSAMRELAETLLPEMDRLRSELESQSEPDRQTLIAKIRERKVTLIDVRPSEEFRSGHLPGALSIPLGELDGRLREIPRSKEVVAYCRGPYCPMALEAVAVLESAGFRARHFDLGAADLGAHRLQLEVVDGKARPRAKPVRRKS